MSTEEIIKGNKLIEIFRNPSYTTDNNNFIHWNDEMGSRIHASVLKYHASWDELMPIVDKIESIHDPHHGYFGVHISSNSCSIQGTNLHLAIKEGSTYGWVYMSDPNAILETKIQSTWYNVVEFIKWYNQNKPSNQ